MSIPTTGGPVFKTITFFVQMLRPGERTLPVRQTAEPAGRAVRGQRAFDRRRPALRLEAVRHARRPGRPLVRARQRLRQGAGVPVRRQRRADAEGARLYKKWGRDQRRRGVASAEILIRRRGPQPAALSSRRSTGELCCLGPIPRLSRVFDCPGGGQVWVEGTTLYVGHMRPPSGTTHRRCGRSAQSEDAGAHRHAGRAGTRTRCASRTAS